MKKKIRREFILVALFTITLTTLLVTAVFYEFFKTEVMDELDIDIQVLQETGVFETEDIETGLREMPLDDLRISLIAQDGSVLYDNDANVGNLGNHGDRPEVSQALQSGKGQSVRRSDTMDESAFYYAVRQEDGTILRVARETSSIWRMFKDAFPIVCVMALAIFGMCYVLATRATKTLMKPIDYLGCHLDECGEIETYEELVPFVQTIKKQHDDIMKNAQMRQDFTANVSHELKTPLTSISGYAELIEHHMASAQDVPRFAGEIHRGANRLLSMINDIIRLSELDVMETEDMVFERVPLYVLAESCVDMLQLKAEKHNVTLELKGTPCYVAGNREMVEEILYNLCDNAIRYNNPGGSVTVTAEPKGEKVMLQVSDTGIGISKEHQQRVFERFYRVDKSRSKATGGTGLGLAIVKHMVAQHHANLTLESEKGKGTTITILFEKADESAIMEHK